MKLIKISIVLFLFFVPLFWLGFIAPSPGEYLIIKEDGKYISGRVILKLKSEPFSLPNGEVNIEILGASAISDFKIKTAKKLFNNNLYETTQQLQNIIEIEYDVNSDPMFVASKLKGLKNVEWAEPRFVYETSYTPNDPSLSLQWYLTKIKAMEAWDINKGDTSIVIGIVDTGIDWDHPDLSANMWRNWIENPNNGIDDDNNGFVDDWIGWDFGGLDGTPDNNPMEDRPDHGTHVGGIASAVTDNGVGVASIGFNTKIMAVKASQDNFRNPQNLALIRFGYEGIMYAAENGADVINLSWGGSGYSILGQNVINAATELGALIVGAAGNSNSSAPFYPASYDKVLSVASTDQGDVKSGFSNYGRSIDVSAPGQGIFNTWQNDTYATLQGTSMAAPLVAGLAGIVKKQFPNFSPIQIGEQIRATSDNINSVNSNYNNLLGKGRINAHRALTETNAKSVRFLSASFSDAGGDGDGIIEPGETISLSLNFINYLAPTTSLIIGLESFSAHATVNNGTFNAGAKSTLEQFSNSGNEFTFTVAGNVPQNTNLVFAVNFVEGSYIDYQWVEVIANPTYATVDNNNITLTVTSKGVLGFNDYHNNQQGQGFKFAGSPNLLFEGALILGTSPTQISDAARGTNQNFQNTDFSSVQPFIINIPGSIADAEGTTIFNDNGAGSNKIGVTTKLTSYSFANSEDNNYIILQYKITNDNSTQITNLHAGLFFDWDIDEGEYDNNITFWDETGSLGYAKHISNSTFPFVGVAVVSNATQHFYPILNAGGDEGINLHDGFDDNEKWKIISSGTARTQAGGGDISNSIAGGPFNIEPGQTIDVAFTIAGGFSVEELRSEVAKARAKYNIILTSVEENEIGIPIEFALNQNYPNPFNPTTVVSYQLPVESKVILKVYDVLGKEVATLVNESQSAGKYNINFNGSEYGNLSSGIYYYKLTAGDFVSTKKMILIK